MNATTQFLTLPGGQIAYDDQGAGPLVLCIPGMGDLRQQYRFLVPQLVEAGYRVVTMDPRGQGESSVDWDDYSVGGIGSDIVALLHHLNVGSAVLCGGSMAAGAAVCAAAEAPERIAGMVVIGGFVRDSMPRWAVRLLFGVVMAQPWGAAFWRKYYPSLYPTRKPADFGPYIARQQAMLTQAGRYRVLQRMMTASKAASAERLDRVHTSVLVVMGTKDPDFPKPEAEAQWVAAQLGGEVFMVPDAGHYPHAEFPEVTGAKILDFLQKIPPVRPHEAVSEATEVSASTGGELPSPGAATRI